MSRGRCLVGLAACCLAACAGPLPDIGEGASPIIGGTADQGDPAIVMLVAYPPDKSTFDTCTASVIAKDVLLTAAHCVDPNSHPGWSFGAFLGPDASIYPDAASLAPQLVEVKSGHMHPDYDTAPPFKADIGVAVLVKPLDIAPLPVNRGAVDASIAGEAARIVGYGQIQYGDLNTKKYDAATVVVSVGDVDTIVVGDAVHHGCVGDSGGPALVKVDGVETIFGVDSYAETTGCLEPAHYRRTDLYTDFLDTYAPPPAEGTGGGGGGGGEPASGGGGSETSGGCVASRASRADSGAAITLLAALFAIRRRRRVVR